MISSVLDNKDELIEKIVKESGKSRKEIEAMIRERVQAYGGLLTEAGAAFSIARELGVSVELPRMEDEWLDIEKVKEELGTVSVVGIVKAVTQIKNWEKDGRKGKLARVLIADKTGELWVVMWNQDAELVENGVIKVGSIIGIKNGIVSKRIDGSLELNVGIRSRIVVDPKVDKEFPEVGETSRISELKEGMDRVSVYGKIIRVFPVREFETNGRRGKVASLIISDGDDIRVVLWGDNANLAEKLKVGDIVKIENGYVKENNGKLEINVGWMGRLVQNPENPPDLGNVEIMSIVRKSISALEPGDLAEIRGTIVNIYPPNLIRVCPVCGSVVEDICPEHNQGKTTLILNLEIDDGTGVIRGILFRDKAERFLGLKEINEESVNEKTKERLGEELVFRGEARMNTLFERMEFIINEFEYPDLVQEIDIATQP